MNQTIIGADGNRVSGWYLGRTNAQGVPFWSLNMKASDDENSASEFAGSTTEAFAATVGKWTHLVGVYNATTKTSPCSSTARRCRQSGPDRWRLERRRRAHHRLRQVCRGSRGLLPRRDHRRAGVGGVLHRGRGDR